jgi:hypothetical protein
MKLTTLAVLSLAAIGSTQLLGQTSTISTVVIGTASTAGGTANGVATVTQRIGTVGNVQGSVGDNLAGIQYVAGLIPLDGAPASAAFYTLTGAAIPIGGAASIIPPAFASYGSLTSPTQVNVYSDVGSKLTPNSYSGLTFAEADLTFGSNDFYTIHHTTGTDYFAEIVPGTGTSSAVFDLKPMSWQAVGGAAGGPADTGLTGYFAISWATGILSLGSPYLDQSIYYLRTDTSSHVQFGVVHPKLTTGSQDTLDLTTAVGSFGVGNYTTLTFSPTAVGNYGANKFYYLRQDTGPGGTGNTILGTLNPDIITAGARTISDIANLGGVFKTLVFAPDATGPSGAWGTNQFFASGTLAAGAQSVSFAAIPNHNVGDVFTVTPTASSGLDIDLTVVSGPATVQTTGVSGATPLSLRVFTVTTTGPGIVKLQARQAGQALPLPLYTANFLQQSFDVLGLPTINSPTAAAGTVSSAFTYDITSTGSPISYAATGLPTGLSLNTSTGAITGTPVAPGVATVTLTSTNPTGTSSPVTLTITVAAAAVPPIISSATAAAGTAGTVFATYTIVATGSPTSYAATGLPVGLALNTVTGAITGTPVSQGVSTVTLTATNVAGTSSPVTLTITVAAAAAVPTITSATTAAGTVGTIFVTYTIVATGTPTSYGATGLPVGLTLNSLSGAITGTPTASGVSTVALTATNITGTSSPVTLTITVAAAAAVPIITSATTAAGTVGTTFVTYSIVATGSPTSYAATGLPAGLTLNTLTGAITGTPTSALVSTVTLTARNVTGTSSPVTLTITVGAAAAVPIITSATTAAGTANTTFVTYTIVATGSPTSYAATGLPAGLTLNTLTGAITGTPTASGVSTVTLTATNGTGTSSPVTLTITIAPAAVAPIITSATTAAGTAHTTFVTYTIVATGSPTSFAATGLPAGLTLNTLTGAITGTPIASGVSTVALTATNVTGTSSPVTLTITVAPAAAVPVITSATTAPGTVNTTFVTYTIVATGSPTSYAATGLPAGLTLNTLTGAITGTPTAAGVSTVALTATNGTGTSSPVTLTITVAAASSAPIITSLTTAPGTVDTIFVTYTIVATGLPTSFGAAGLPAGLALDPLAGTITGTPTAAGVSNVTLTATNTIGTSSPVTLTITVAAAGTVPSITSAITAPGTINTTFVTYTIVATGSPTSYGATGLPPGLTISSLTGAITGTPTATGVSVVTLSATNLSGTGTATLTITVAAAGVAPVITSPAAAAGTINTTFVTYTIAATGLPTSFAATGLPAGLAVDSTTGVITGTPTATGVSVVTLDATNTTGTGTASLTITIAAASVVPVITNPVNNPTGTVGSVFPSYPIVATGSPTSYTATGLPTGLSIDPVTGVINGTPTESGTFVVTITATNATGTATTTLTIVIAAEPISWISSFSARGLTGTGDQILILGFWGVGTNATYLLEGVGPTLANYGVSNVVADPTLALFGAGATSPTASNNDWETNLTGTPNAAAIVAASAQVGAPPLPSGSKDSALLATLAGGGYTVEVAGANGTTGTALAAVYDADVSPGAGILVGSARGNIAAGGGVIIAGLYISGSVPMTVLIRGTGPALLTFGVTDALADPSITVYSGQTPIATNSGWGTPSGSAAQISSTSDQVGAYPLASGSKDAAVILTLQPGAYTIVGTSASGGTGVMLIEAYNAN